MKTYEGVKNQKEEMKRKGLAMKQELAVKKLKSVTEYAAQGVADTKIALRERGATYWQMYTAQLAENEQNAWDAGYTCAMKGILNVLKERGKGDDDCGLGILDKNTKGKEK